MGEAKAVEARFEAKRGEFKVVMTRFADESPSLMEVFENDLLISSAHCPDVPPRPPGFPQHKSAIVGDLMGQICGQVAKEIMEIIEQL